MDLEAVKNCWNRLAKTNPVGAMLSSDANGINSTADLFALGRRETDELLSHVKSLNLALRYGKALDFGCGLGRVTQALAQYFERVYGIDIAPAIVELANSYNQHPNTCEYLVNQTNDLRTFQDNSFDFVWSYGTLHLVEPHYFADYIKEFFRILVPGGLLVFFQAAEPAKTLKGRILRMTPVRAMNLYHRSRYGFEVHGMPRKEVIDLLQRLGGRVLKVKEDRSTPGPTWVGYQYFVVKEKTLSAAIDSLTSGQSRRLLS